MVERVDADHLEPTRTAHTQLRPQEMYGRRFRRNRDFLYGSSM